MQNVLFIAVTALVRGVAVCPGAQSGLGTYHITGLSGGAHDLNAIFQWKDTWHVMNQRNNNWGHLVSKDFIHWTRLPDALDSGSWDGSLSIVNGAPLILYDCTSIPNCLPPKEGGSEPSKATNGQGDESAHRSNSSKLQHRQQQRRSGDPPLIGVARPADLSDANLTHWVKDSRNPAHFGGAPATYSGPSNVWTNTATGKFQMEMILGGTTGLFETSDPTFHNWSMVDDKFYPIRGGGGGMFFPLPKQVAVDADVDAGDRADGANATAPIYTHMMQEDFRGFGDGEPRFVLGTFDPATSKFTPGDDNGGGGVNIDFSADIVFSLVNVVGDRMVHMGWVTGSDCLSIPREITYDPALHQLLSNPVQEMAGLRERVIGAISSPATVTQPTPLALVKPSAGSAATQSYDMDAEFALPSGSAFDVRVSFFGAGPDPATDSTGLLLSISATAPAADPRGNVGGGGSRNVTVFQCACGGKGCCDSAEAAASGSPRKYTFTLPAEETTINVRALVDVNIAEVFVADGRAAYTASARAGSPAATGVYIFAPTAPVLVNNATVWSMGCGWTHK